jgi:hypothetical protein
MALQLANWPEKQLTRCEMRAILQAIKSGMLSQTPWTDLPFGLSRDCSEIELHNPPRHPLLALSGLFKKHQVTFDVCFLDVKRTSGRHATMSAFDPKRTWRGHWNLRKIEHRREPPEGNMQRRGGSRQSVKEQRTTRQKTRKAPTTHVSAADFPAFFVIDDKGNDFFKDSNLG